jgi:hypothetical protein
MIEYITGYFKGDSGGISSSSSLHICGITSVKGLSEKSLNDPSRHLSGDEGETDLLC